MLDELLSGAAVAVGGGEDGGKRDDAEVGVWEDCVAGAAVPRAIGSLKPARLSDDGDESGDGQRDDVPADVEGLVEARDADVVDSADVLNAVTSVVEVLDGTFGSVEDRELPSRLPSGTLEPVVATVAAARGKSDFAAVGACGRVGASEFPSCGARIPVGWETENSRADPWPLTISVGCENGGGEVNCDWQFLYSCDWG